MSRAIRMLLGAALALGACSGHAASPRATPDTLQQLIDNARSGDTIWLDAGDYAPIRVKDLKWDPPLVVEAGEGRLTSVVLNGVSGLVWRGGSFDGADVARTGFSAGTSDHITVEKLQLSRYKRNGIIFVNTSDSRIAGNTMSNMGSDGIDIAMSRRIVIDGNSCRDFQPTPKAHPDCIQLWSRPSAPPVADITITNNTVHGDMQGISMFNHTRDGVNDGGFDRITVTGNTVEVTSSQGLAVIACRDCNVTGNTIRRLPGAAHYVQLNIKRGEGGTLCGNRTDSMKEPATNKCRR